MIESDIASLLSGFYPRIHDRGLHPSQALADYFATYVQRDLRQLAAVQDLQRFERLCAGRTDQLLNLSDLGNEAVVSHATARAWITRARQARCIFTGTLRVTRLICCYQPAVLAGGGRRNHSDPVATGRDGTTHSNVSRVVRVVHVRPHQREHVFGS